MLESIALQWLKDRWAERTTWDGWMLFGVGVVGLLFSPLVKWVSWIAIGYGIWTFIKEEKDNE